MRALFPSRLAFPAAGGLLALALAGCSAAAPLPFQARPDAAMPANMLAYGYADARVDARHYAVIYTDRDKERAQNYLTLRAAQIAQAAGYSYFAFDKQGTDAVRKTEIQFDQDMITKPQHSRTPSFAIPLNSYIPQNDPTSESIYFSAAGKISLLTPEQARGNPKAIEVAPVLAKMGAPEKS